VVETAGASGIFASGLAGAIPIKIENCGGDCLLFQWQCGFLFV
jgi:hypothetical protein